MATGLHELIPGLAEAEDLYKREQIEAFSGIEPAICGLDVLPFTAQMYLHLDGADSPFFDSREVDESDIAVFLYRVSPAYANELSEARDLFTTMLACAIQEHGPEAMKSGIYEYIRRSWSGMPMFKGSTNRQKSPSSWVSHIVHMFAKEYGWTDEYILNKPFSKLWQYANRILEDKDENYKEHCAEAVKMRAQWLQEQNSKNLK